MPFLLPNQQCQSTEGSNYSIICLDLEMHCDSRSKLSFAFIFKCRYIRVVGSVLNWNTFTLKTAGKFLASHCLFHQAADLVEMLCGWEVSRQLLDGCGLPLTTYQLQLTAGSRCCRQTSTALSTLWEARRTWTFHCQPHSDDSDEKLVIWKTLGLFLYDTW